MEVQDKSLTTLLFKEGFPGKRTTPSMPWGIVFSARRMEGQCGISAIPVRPLLFFYGQTW